MKYTIAEAKKYILLALDLSSTLTSRARNNILFGYEALGRVRKIMNNTGAREDNLPDILNELKSRKSNVKELLSEYEKPEYKENEKALTYFSKNFKTLIMNMKINPQTDNKSDYEIKHFYKENKHVKELTRNLVKLRNLEQELSKGEEKIKSLMN